MFNEPDTHIATLSTPIRLSEDLFNPNVVKLVRDANGYALYFSRQAIPYQRNTPEEKWSTGFTYHKHIGIYAYRYDVLTRISKLDQSALEKAESLEQLRWLENGFRIRTRTIQQETIGIDTPEDLDLARKML
jgi:3-deoxy-manno-octulosonate cytidylyltransferase (CMP-KDO synthetase)